MKTFSGVTFFLCLVFAGKVFACTCPPGDSIAPRTAIKEADVIFSGTVVRGEMLRDQSPRKEAIPYVGRRYRFDVIRAFKGKIGTEVEIETGIGRGDCGYSFAIGGGYLVYAFRVATKLKTSGCNRIVPLYNAQEDLAELKKILR